MIPSSINVFAVTSTVLSIISLECNAQLFPWSNLKHYFDQKTKDGPGNGGVLTLPVDQTANSNSHVPSSTELAFEDSINDSTTAGTISKHNNNKHLYSPFSLDSLSTHVPPQTDDHRLRNHLNKPKPSQIRVNIDSGYSLNGEQPFFPYRPNDDELESFQSDESVRIEGTNPSKHGEIHSHNTPSPILITQKPLVLSPNAGSDDSHRKSLIQNRVSSHKSVSIMPSSSLTIGEDQNGRINVGIKSQPTQNPSLFVTPRPIMSTSAPYNDKTVNLNNRNKNIHKPKRQRPLSRPGIQYSDAQMSNGKEGGKRIKKPNLILSKNNDLPSSRNPLFVTPPSTAVSSIPLQQDPYSFSRPNHGETLIVESIPSISIALKPSSNNKPTGATNIRPIFIPGNSNGNGNSAQSGLVDYLVPPKLSPSFPNVHAPTSQPNISPTFPNVHVHNSQQNIFDDKRIENEMTRLKPPQPTNVSINRPKKSNHKKVQNDDVGINNHNMRDHNSRVPTKQRNKFHNHKMTQTQESVSTQNENMMRNHNEDDNQNHHRHTHVASHKKLMKNHNNDPHHAAASHIDEQISSETGFLRTPTHHSTGERVEFQMHGQNGPKSYKFGYDTGKGHNRQFRYEERDKHGHVKGHYGYYDKDGKLQLVNYEADPETGFKANPVDMSPEQN